MTSETAVLAPFGFLAAIALKGSILTAVTATPTISANIPKAIMANKIRKEIRKARMG